MINLFFWAMFKYDLVAALQYSTPTLYGEGIVVFDHDTQTRNNVRQH
jgi:hypothetical protein